MTEAYDWLLEAKLDLAHQAVSQIPTQDLGYPASKVAYLSGFVPDASIAYIYGFDKTNHIEHLSGNVFLEICKIMYL